MTKQIINVGTTANDKKGDSLRAAFTKVNANFTELYPQTSVPATSKGKVGDIAGMSAFNNTYYYYCIGTYDGTTDIWRRMTHPVGTW